MPPPKPGKYDGLADFIKRNSLHTEFSEAITGDDRTVEAYLQEYSYRPDLEQCVLDDMANYHKWRGRFRFEGPNKFTFGH